MKTSVKDRGHFTIYLYIHFILQWLPNNLTEDGGRHGYPAPQADDGAAHAVRFTAAVYTWYRAGYQRGVPTHARK